MPASVALRDQRAAMFSGGDSVGQVGSAKVSVISKEQEEPTPSRCELIRCRLLSKCLVFSDFGSPELSLLAVWLH
jgi:hypothetical protein